MSQPLKGVGFAALGFALFSSHDVIIKALGASFSPIQIVFFSTLLGFPVATLLLMQDATKGTLIPKYPGWVAVRTMSAVSGAICIFYAFSVLPLSQVYAIIFASPLVITVLSIPILGEKVGIHRWLAVLMGLIGVIIVVRPGVQTLEFGHFTAMFGAASIAGSSVIMRRIGREERSVVIMLYPMMANVVVMGALLPFVYQPVAIDQLGGFLAIAVLGFLGGLCLISAYRNAEAAVVAPIQYSQIIWAVLFGALLFDEWPDFYTSIGASIIILSGLYVLMRESRAHASQNTPVLRTRTRLEAGGSFRIGTLIRMLKAEEDQE
ncbi:MAG: DMT family transporter [Paracoccaceae bacterium]|nr:DMT family transporter [Paracoccaceae bacterium]